MGVQGLWELLAPVGRRVSVETLSGKKLAIDASIWMIQFMKAMRDERGEMVRNAHLLGFFRRICKLLFLRAKPVFVFDGGTPALKRRTVAARRRHRENARAKIRKTAEKLLLNHLKSKRLEELAEEVKISKSGIKGDLNGKHVTSANDDSPSLGKASSYGLSCDRAINQENLDELLAASIAAEEEGKLAGYETVPDVKFEEEGEGDEDEEMIFPLGSGNIDPAVLASLPPSMQLDLLDQMREKLMAENRQKYQKFKKVPAKFSELQIQSYLKTVAFRREINEVQKCASGRGVGGLQTSRIASEANREYIFSSSFTGDKQTLTPTAAEKNDGIINHEVRMSTFSDASKRNLFMSSSNASVDTSSDMVSRETTPDVETYLDDRGRVRVSRVRGLGIRMTRDLQRNLDLMKEHEQVLVKDDLNNIPELVCDNATSDFPNESPSEALIDEESSHYTSIPLASDGIYEEISRGIGRSIAIPEKEPAIQISFLEGESEPKIMDNFFMNLVSRNTTEELYSESMPLEKRIDDSDSECIWEDRVVGEHSSSLISNDEHENKSSFLESKDCEEDDIVWEEGASIIPYSVESGEGVSRRLLEEEADLKRNDEHENQSSFIENKGCEEDEIMWEEGASVIPHSMQRVEVVSQGLLEEEAYLREAIRRSLQDIKSKQSSSAVPVRENTMAIVKDQNSSILVKNDDIDIPVQKAQLQSASMGFLHNINAHRFIASDNEHLYTSILHGCLSDGESSLKDDKTNIPVCDSVELLHDIQPKQCKSQVQKNLHGIALKLMNDEPNLGKADDHALESYTKSDFDPTCNRVESSSTDALNNSVTIPSDHTSEIRSGICSSYEETLGVDLSNVNLTENIPSCVDKMQELAENDTYKDLGDRLSYRDQASIQDEDSIAASEANLQNEISILKQERAYLGNEQRKLERNAESVTNEMFAECQELLQMFGLPYIIAPMEAEAQCAYMEMTNLVDGIVTDDSDVFLFGARNVFKNIFDDRKYVETYFMKDIENELGLNRDKLIHMALLLGSDYTEGVSGIGIVNAIEVINAFPEKDGLLKFKNWVETPDPSILGLHFSQHDGNGMGTNIEYSASQENVLGGVQSADTIRDTEEKKVFMDKHRNVSKNWHFPPSFPSDPVVTAYISPQIDESTESFAWGKPDLPLLRKMCWEKFGWPTQKADELLVPVLKEYNKHETQLRMEAFYSFNERFAKIRSGRIKKAVKGITGISSSGLTDIGDGGSSSRKRRGTALPNDEQSQLENDADRPVTTKRKSSKKSQKTTNDQSPPPHMSAESSKQAGRSYKRGQMVNARGRGRGREGGRCKRREGEHLNEEFIEPVSINGNSASESQRSIMMPESREEKRKSTRRRKQVNYTEEDDSEINELRVPDKAMNMAVPEHFEAVTKSWIVGGDDTDSFNQAMSQDYLQSSRGFCPEESEIPEEQFARVSTRTTLPFERNDGDCQWPIGDGNIGNYLATGGGFCVDESDVGVVDEFEKSDFDLGTNDQDKCSEGYEEAAVEDLDVLEDSGQEEDEAGGSAMHPLSVMPSLKRKRRT